MDIQKKMNELDSYANLIKVGIHDLQKELDKKDRTSQPKKKSSVLTSDDIARIKAMRSRQS